MKNFGLFLFACILSVNGFTQKIIQLPNGWQLSPAGRSFQLGDLPLNMAVSPSGKLLAVTCNGYNEHLIQLIDVRTEKITSENKIGNAWVGLCFNGENELYASGGNDNRVMKYSIINKKLIAADSFYLPAKKDQLLSVAGIQVDGKNHLLYIVTRLSNSLYVIDTKTKQLLTQTDLGAEAYNCVLSPNKKELYISVWGDDRISIYDTEKAIISGQIKVGDNPNDLCLTKSGRFMFVANSNDNTVSVIDLMKRKVIETLNAALYPDAPNGSTTNAVTLSTDEKTLYIANADNNCLTVFDVSKPGFSKPKGFIPTGWYPTCVKIAGKKIFVSNGKGFTSMSNAYGPNPFDKNSAVIYQHGDTSKKKKVQTEYIGNLFHGTMSVIIEPSAQQLSIYSQQVYRNTPYNKKKETETEGMAGNPIPRKVGDKSPIKYVFYIIKENRTYDQVLGDVKTGNGDTALVLFGERITPNQHKLVNEFVLLDNFYVDAEVSADGHNWSNAAYANDYVEKVWPSSYGGHGGDYDYEGLRKLGWPKSGFIWDHCKKYGVSYRTYGEFADDYKPNIPVLKDHFCPYYTSWDDDVKDTTRFNQWKRDFDSLLAIDKVPQYNSLRFINDHTEGMSKGRPTPFAHVADNDLAVGLFVEYLSKSRIWNESVVFIVEDDAQNGADHVDAHRSTAYVAGGFVKRGYVDHTMYSTSSMLRTIELILGMPPMSQYDAAATPMWRSFQSTPDATPFIAVPNNIDLNERNTAINEWQRQSELFDLSKEDAVDDVWFNEVLWYGIKGEHIPFPGPKRAAFVKIEDKKDDDD
jgi:YVTN family beta-propeller protein